MAKDHESTGFHPLGDPREALLGQDSIDAPVLVASSISRIKNKFFSPHRKLSH